jgi:serine/threonine protein kinase
MSEYLNKDFKSDSNNITLSGSYEYIGPEIFIVYNKYANDTDEKSVVMQEIYNDMFKLYKKTQTKLNNFNLNNYKQNISQLYDKIEKYYNNGTILEKYFGNNKYDGYLQKSDIYGLGINIYKSLYYHNEIDIKHTNPKLYNLLMNMIKFDPDERYNVLQCLNHPYFTKQ